MPFPLAAAISGASALGSSLLSNSGSRKAQDRANAQNIKFWNMQNKYNDPSAQMSRLRKAGLNPNLIYGTGGSTSVGNAQNVAPSKPAPYNIENPIANVTKYADVQNTEQQTDNLKAQNTVLAQEAILKGAQTAEIGVKTARNKFDLGLASELRDTSLQAAQANLRSMEQGALGAKLDVSFKDQSLKNRLKDIKYRAENAKQTLKGTQLDNALKQLEKDLKEIGIEKNDPWYFRILGRNKEAAFKAAMELQRKPKN